MTAKEELSQYKYARERVEEALEEYKKYQDRATKMTALLSNEPIGSGGTSDKVGKNGSYMADISEQYEERWIKAELERNKILGNIDLMPEPYRKLLTERYIKIGDDNKLVPFEKVATQIGYSYSETTTLHGEALKIYTEKFLT